MLTADTITDEQIRALRDAAQGSIDHEDRWWLAHRHLWTGSARAEHDLLISEQRRIVEVCEVALYDVHTRAARESAQHKARVRCAELLNARTKETR